MTAKGQCDMAAHNILCRYKDTAGSIGGFAALPDGGIYTGHHLIADHCFMIAAGIRGAYGSLLVFQGYNVDEAPVVIVTADANGGKSREHGGVHLQFDPAEASFKDDQQWTYKQAREAAVDSVFAALGLVKVNVRTYLDAYFKLTLGMDDTTMLRAGEFSVFPGYQARKSPRYKPY